MKEPIRLPDPTPQSPSEDPERALATLTALVAGLARETHPGLRAEVTPDSALEADLGLDSLGRVELIHRVEQAFSVQLPEKDLLAVETPRDLLQALRLATGAPGWAAFEAPAPATDATFRGPPSKARTLIEVLDWHEGAHGARRHVLFYADAQRTEALSCAELARGAREVAAGLLAHGLQPGQTVAIMLPTCLEFFLSFYGILLAGGVPVPIYPPARLNQIEDHLKRQSGILSSARAALLVTVPEARLLARFLRATVDTLSGVLTVPELRAAGSAPERPAPGFPEVRPGDTAFIQYTSGSTGNPKGVVLTHANLLANIRAWGQAVRLAHADVCVSWLPLYHDMGLIGTWLGMLYHGGLLVLMSPLDFLARPERWLQAIHRHRGTVTAAPNFAFELCLKRVPDEVIEAIDLSSWRLAANGAEPVSPDTLERFAARFARCGFRREALAPVYGLAECTVGLAIPPLARGPLIDRVDRAAMLREGRAAPAAAHDPHALRYVACGRALPGHEMRVVDGAGREVGERTVGRLQFRGPSATSGYFRNPEETRRLFEGSWVNTGDIAYLAGGEVYLTSRAKDMIIRGGHNLYPYELEEAVGNIEGMRKGCVAVVGVPDPDSGTERLVVIAETRPRERVDPQALRARINALSIESLGSPPDEVVLAPPGSVLKTSSGKIRRAATRDLYVSGAIGRRGSGYRWQIARLALASAWSAGRRGLRRARAIAFGLRAWMAFALLAPLAWLSVVLAGRPERAWRAAGTLARLFFRLAGIPVEVNGRERLPRDAAWVLVANHASYLDGLLLVAAIPQPHHFLAKRELAGAAISRLFLGALGSRYVERFDAARGVEDVRRFTALAREGRRLAVFPEGTIRRQAGLQPFLMGAFVTAAETGRTVVPLAIRGAREILRDETWFPRPGAVTLTIGEPLRPDAAGWEAAVRLRERARSEILKHCGEPDLTR